MSSFDQTVIDAVTSHMNGDHPEDNLLIAQAFGDPLTSTSVMVGLDGEAGIWHVNDSAGEHELRVNWPGAPINERPEIRREVVLLYKAACEKLGVEPREEHAPEVSGQHGHGEGHRGPGHAQHGGGAAHGSPHGSAHGSPHGDSGAEETFSYRLRTATWADHGDSESSTVMEEIIDQKAALAEYTSLVVQHYFAYEALEEAAQLLAADDRYQALHPAALVRLPAIEEDLAFLIGDNWKQQVSALPATVAYAQRIREVAAEGWLEGVIAHHYTRYLGDLSGGQIIAKKVAEQHGFDRAGVAFYDFTELGPIPRFKKTYRDVLNSLEHTLSEEEQQRVIDEVRLAYKLNNAVFADMQRELSAS